MNVGGRPQTGLDINIQAYICEQLTTGRALISICKDEQVTINSGAVRYHLINDPGFFDSYEIARNIGLDVMAEELLDIADDGTNDYMIKVNKDGTESEVVNTEHIQRSRLRTDVRKWFLSKLAPKRYGERIQTDITNSDGSLKNIDMDQVGIKIQSILDRARQAKAISGKVIDVENTEEYDFI